MEVLFTGLTVTLVPRLAPSATARTPRAFQPALWRQPLRPPPLPSPPCPPQITCSGNGSYKNPSSPCCLRPTRQLPFSITSATPSRVHASTSIGRRLTYFHYQWWRKIHLRALCRLLQGKIILFTRFREVRMHHSLLLYSWPVRHQR